MFSVFQNKKLPRSLRSKASLASTRPICIPATTVPLPPWAFCSCAGGYTPWFRQGTSCIPKPSAPRQGSVKSGASPYEIQPYVAHTRTPGSEYRVLVKATLILEPRPSASSEIHDHRSLASTWTITNEYRAGDGIV